MRLCDKINNRIGAWLPTMVLFFCVIQPLLDVAGYWQQYFKVSNAVTLALRMLLLGGSVLLGFLLSDRKRYYFITAGVLGLLTVLHVIACVIQPGEYISPITDLVNLVRIYFMPMTVLCFITFVRRNEKVFESMKLGMVLTLVIIALVQLLATLTHTDPHTYANDKTGVLGWFLWTNSQSAILAILAPVSICWALQRWPDKLLPIALITALAEAPLFFLAPRLAFFSFIVAGVGVAICLLLVNRKRWKQTAAIVLVTVLFVSAYPYSPTNARLHTVAVINNRNQSEVTQMDIHITTVPAPAAGHKTKEEKPRVVLDKNTREKVEKIYKGYVFGMVQHFGLDRVLEAYDYTLNTAILGSQRTKKITFCTLLMEDAGVMNRLFGMNLLDMREFIRSGFYDAERDYWEDGYENYDVENDFHGIYFLTGIVGLILMIAFLLYFGLRALWRVIRDFKTYFTLDMVGFAIAYCCCLAHAYFTASVLRRNNASVYMAMVLVALWYLSRKELSAKLMAKADAKQSN